MTKQEMIRDLLMAHVYSAFDEPKDAWREVSEEYLQKKTGDITAAEIKTEVELEAVHIELYEAGAYGNLENLINAMVESIANPQKYAMIDKEWEPTDDPTPQTEQEIMDEIRNEFGFPEGGGDYAGWKIVKWDEWIKMRDEENE